MSLFFYDNQIRRWIQQIIAVFSKFEVQIGVDPTGSPTYRRVPVRYGDITRMAAAIIKENSENKMNTVPIMTVSITALKYDRDRVQNPTHVNKLHIRERKYNNETDTYSMYQGNAVTVERIMPVPYEMTFNLDIWTSNTEQKLQLLEQILPLFNPDLELQSTDNFIDWTSLSYILLDDVSWSGRTIPQGTEDQIDVATLTFKLPIWMSLPAKVKKLGVIQTIIASLYDAQGDVNEDVISTANLLRNRMYITPTGYNLLLLNGQATLTPAMGPINRSTDPESNPNNPIEWQPLVNLYGQLINGTSQIRLRKDNPDTVSEIVGTIAYHPADPSTLLFSVDVDTIPSNSLPPVNAIIDPQRSAPGIGLPSATAGQRYLILTGINEGKVGDTSFDGADAWKSNDSRDLYAQANDIISYNGTGWEVSWQSNSVTKTEYITNLKTAIQYKWSNNKCQKSYEGVYPAGTWSLVL